MPRKGFTQGKSQQRTDSSHILAAIRILNRVELVGEAMRRVLDEIAQVAPGWLTPLIQPEWGQRYGRRMDTHRLSQTKRKALAKEIGADGHFLFKAITREDTVSTRIVRKYTLSIFALEVAAEQLGTDAAHLVMNLAHLSLTFTSGDKP